MRFTSYVQSRFQSKPFVLRAARAGTVRVPNGAHQGYGLVQRDEQNQGELMLQARSEALE